MLEWLQHNLGKVIALIFVLISVGRSVAEARGKAEPPPADAEEERRVREVQEKIRRTIAERRRAGGPAAPAPSNGPAPAPAPMELPVPDPLGELGRRLQAELERRFQPESAPASVPAPVSPPMISRAELERQQRLADDLRRINEERQRAGRRAEEQAAAAVAAAGTIEARRVNARGLVVADLGDRASLRRAFVLREVLGTPAGLR